MLSAAVQRRLQAVIREELSFLSRRSTDQAVTCIMVHLASVASMDPETGGSPSSGDESDESVRTRREQLSFRRNPRHASIMLVPPRRPPPPLTPTPLLFQSERDRRVEHLRAIFGLSPADAERVAILGDELRRQHRIVSRLSSGTVRTADLNADRCTADAGAFRRDAAGADGAGAGGWHPLLRGGGGPMMTTPGEIAELTMLAAVDRLCDKLRMLRGPAPSNVQANAQTAGLAAWTARVSPPLIVGSVHGRSWSPGSNGAVQPKRARIMASPLLPPRPPPPPPPPPPLPDDDTDANTDGERVGGNSKRARLL